MYLKNYSINSLNFFLNRLEAQISLCPFPSINTYSFSIISLSKSFLENLGGTIVSLSPCKLKHFLYNFLNIPHYHTYLIAINWQDILYI